MYVKLVFVKCKLGSTEQNSIHRHLCGYILSFRFGCVLFVISIILGILFYKKVRIVKFSFLLPLYSYVMTPLCGCIALHFLDWWKIHLSFTPEIRSAVHGKRWLHRNLGTSTTGAQGNWQLQSLHNGVYCHIFSKNKSSLFRMSYFPNGYQFNTLLSMLVVFGDLLLNRCTAK